jgi:hypothetical protein
MTDYGGILIIVVIIIAILYIALHSDDDIEDNMSDEESNAGDSGYYAREPEFGKKVGELTQFGDTWINLGKVVECEFDMDDDDDEAQVRYKHQTDYSSINSYSTKALKKFFMGQPNG